MLKSKDCKVTFSVVVYKQSIEELRKVLQSILLYPYEKTIFVVDNTPIDSISDLCKMDSCIVYKPLPQDLGFGIAHNWAFAEARKLHSQFHVIVNPDIVYQTDVVEPMIDYMIQHPNIGEMMPRILNPDGTIQFLPKLIPSPMMLIARRMRRLLPFWYNHCMKNFEMRNMRTDKVYDVGHVSGSFAVFRMEALDATGGFDDCFYLYFEDTDLSRRMQESYRTVYYPMVTVFHDYGNGASHNVRLFKIFIISLIKYFNKWGWFFDRQRRISNRRFLKQLEK